MMATFKAMKIELTPNTPVNLDPGFDSKSNKAVCLKFGLSPNIKCNPPNTKKAAVAPDMPIYRERYVNERAFASEDTYRRLVTRYVVYARNHLAFTYMAAALILLRLIV
ncbi:MAG: Transposase domain [Bacteroidota bacterium]|jgi:hypothetical protein